MTRRRARPVAILFVIIATFASILHILFVQNGDDEDDDEEGGDEDEDEDEVKKERPFRSIGGALLTLFRMAPSLRPSVSRPCLRLATGSSWTSA